MNGYGMEWMNNLVKAWINWKKEWFQKCKKNLMMKQFGVT